MYLIEPAMPARLRMGVCEATSIVFYVMSISALVLPKKLCAKIHLLPLVVLVTARSTAGSTTTSAHHVTSPAITQTISISVVNVIRLR